MQTRPVNGAPDVRGVMTGVLAGVFQHIDPDGTANAYSLEDSGRINRALLHGQRSVRLADVPVPGGADMRFELRWEQGPGGGWNISQVNLDSGNRRRVEIASIVASTPPQGGRGEPPVLLHPRAEVAATPRGATAGARTDSQIPPALREALIRKSYLTEATAPFVDTIVFQHVGPGGTATLYSPEENACITRALCDDAGGRRSVRLVGAPGLRFEVRWDDTLSHRRALPHVPGESGLR